MFSIEIPYCNLAKIFNGNQSYRWRKVSENKYIVIDGKRIVLLEQKKNRKIFICSEDDFFDYWFNYFDCNFDYGKTLFDIKRFYKEIKQYNFFISFVVKDNRTYRMLKNDLFETMIYYAIDEKDRQQKFERFLQTFGEKKINSLSGLKITWYKFPDPEKIDLSFNCGLNKEERKRIQQIIQNVNNNILERIKTGNERIAHNFLYKICHDETWIKNVMFYSLGFKNMFCINDEMKQFFKINNVKPECFTKFDDIKGFLLQLTKVK